jgi:hypothetical protein
MAMKPWFPTGRASVVHHGLCQRANMIASGKMFVANALPAFMLALFDWNPLFHIIDQIARLRLQQLHPRITPTGNIRSKRPSGSSCWE